MSSSDPRPAKAPRKGIRSGWWRVVLLIGAVCVPAGFAAGRIAEADAAPAAPATAPDGLLDASSAPAWRAAFLPRLRSQPQANLNPLPHKPHPAVARIVVPEGRATAYGSGTLVDVWGEHGLVVTNWHVVRDSQGVVEVVFPCGFRSNARPLKVDSNWDLAALVIWRPPVEPVQFAAQPPRPGDVLTIHGYGRGQYRIATGRCTKYYAPRINFPHELVELDVEARQGDSGGPIFNDRGELAGVLFGAGQGTTLGSFGPRVRHFLTEIAPDIGKDKDQVAVADRPAPKVQAEALQELLQPANKPGSAPPSSPWPPPDLVVAGPKAPGPTQTASNLHGDDDKGEPAYKQDALPDGSLFESLKSALAVIGLAAIALQLIKMVR